MKQRVSGVIIEGDKNLLLIKRIKLGKEYYVFPGGSVEEGENPSSAMLREINEELSVHANIGKLLFKIQNREQEEIFFEIISTIGVPEIGGPEKERSNDENQYHIEWVELKDLNKMQNVYPAEAREKILELFA